MKSQNMQNMRAQRICRIGEHRTRERRKGRIGEHTIGRPGEHRICRTGEHRI
jgi:hypothetical protein